MNKNQKKFRLAILLSHPINYKIDLYKELNRHPDVNVTVYFCSDFGIRTGVDKTSGTLVKWYDKKILEGLPHKFLKNYSPNKNSPLDNLISGAINPGIFSELLRNRYDAVVIDGYMMLTNWISFLTAWITRTPIIFKGDVYLLNQRKKITAILKKFTLPVLFKNFDAFLGYSSTNINYYKYYGVPENKIFFAPYAVNNDLFQLKYKELITKKSELKKAEGINPKLPIILSTSKLITRKRPIDLLRAYEIVDKNKSNQAQLIFIGNGPEKESLENYAKIKRIKNVYFLGFKNQSEIVKYYAMADIFVLPSETEIWGLVVNEAMNFSLPVIATDMVGAGYDIVKVNQNGFIYKVGDINELSTYLLKLVKDAELRKKMGGNSLKIINNWNYKKAVSGIVEALKSLKKPRVIVAQPGSHHLWRTAHACQKNGLLKYYATGVYYKPDKFPYFLAKIFSSKLKNRIISQLNRRRYPELEQSKIKTYGFYEWLYIINNYSIKSNKLSDWLINRRNSDFSIKVGKLVKKNADIVWSGMDAALETFLIAKPKRVVCVLDQFVGHPLSLNKIIKEEIKLYPVLKTVTENLAPDSKIKRFCQEMELADIIVAGSNFVKETLIENNVPLDKIAVIPYGVDTKRFRPQTKKTDDGIFRLLFVGHISVRKGCHYLLESVKQLNRPDIKLTMVGEMEGKYFIDHYKNYFNWIPPIPHSQLPQYFNQADIYVYPSLFEGSSLSVYEALASGLPVITTPNSGSVVRNNKDGFIIPIRDIKALKEKILLLYNNKVLRQKMAKNARQQAENYTWEIYRQKVIELIQEISEK